MKTILILSICLILLNIGILFAETEWVGFVEGGGLFRMDLSSNRVESLAVSGMVQDFIWEKAGDSMLYVQQYGDDFTFYRLNPETHERELHSTFTFWPDYEYYSPQDERLYAYLEQFPDGALYCRVVVGEYAAPDEQIYFYVEETGQWEQTSWEDFWDLYGREMFPPDEASFRNMLVDGHYEVFYVEGETSQRLTYTDHLERNLPEEYSQIEYHVSPDKKRLLCLVPVGIEHMPYGPSYLVDLTGMQVELSNHHIQRHVWTRDSELLYVAWMDRDDGESGFMLCKVSHNGLVEILRDLSWDSPRGFRLRIKP